MADEAQPWWIVAAAAVPPLLISLWQRHRDSADKRADRETQERLRLMSSMDAATLASFQRLESDLLRERTRRVELEAENERQARTTDRAWDLAHAWRRRARELRHDLVNAYQLSRPYMPVGENGPHVWPPVPALPDVEGIET